MGSNSKLKTQNSKLAKLPGLLLDWFATNARDLPWRRTHDAYSVWVSEIILQNTEARFRMGFSKHFKNHCTNESRS